MTNYINSITVDNASYPIGPLKLDDYDNIVSHNINLQSQQRSNVIIGNSSFELDPSTITFSNNIIIGKPSLDTITNTSNNVIIGNSRNLMHITNESINCYLGSISMSISMNQLMLGPLALKRYEITNAASTIQLEGPTDVFAIGSCVTSDYAGATMGYAHVLMSVSTVDDRRVRTYSVVGGTVLYADNNAYKGAFPYPDFPEACFLVGSGVDSNKLFFNVGSNFSAASGFNLEVYTYSWPRNIF